MGTIEEGVKQAIENCLKVKKGEEVVIITDRQTLDIGSALRAAAEKITGKPARFFLMEDFGARPIPFPQAIEEAMSVADVSIYAAQGAKGELATFRQPMIRTIEASPKLRHGHMIGITPEIMKDGMCSDYKEIQRISKLVYEKVKNARAIRVVTDKGNDFTAEFSPELKWTVSDGDIHAEPLEEPAGWRGVHVAEDPQRPGRHRRLPRRFLRREIRLAGRDAHSHRGQRRPGPARKPAMRATRSCERNWRRTSSRPTRTAAGWANSPSAPTPA